MVEIESRIHSKAGRREKWCRDGGERGRESAAVLPGLKDGAEPWPIPLDAVWAGRALAGGRDIHEPTRVGQCAAKKRNTGRYTENQTVVGANSLWEPAMWIKSSSELVLR